MNDAVQRPKTTTTTTTQVIILAAVWFCYSNALSIIPSKGADSIRVVSWNLLADVYASPKKYPCTSACNLNWTTRSTRILQQLQTINADILCLQEVQLSTWPEFRRECEERLNYQCQIVQNVTQPHPVALVILMRPNLISRIVAVESRSRALLTVLQLTRRNNVTYSNDDSNNPIYLFLANVHLHAGQTALADQQRFYQVQSWLKRMKLQQARCGIAAEDHCNVLVLGDFNCEHDNPLYELLTTGNLSPAADWWGRTKSAPLIRNALQGPSLPFLPLVDAYRSSLKASHDNQNNHSQDARHRVTFRSGGSLDHVFYTPSSRMRVHPLLWLMMGQSYVSDPQSQRHKRRLPWPDDHHPSDHLPIGVDVELL
jgi:mRNA deadenylase 3'-5' endonuclease subunit Ccr4